jgi:hypothetical protein
MLRYKKTKQKTKTKNKNKKKQKQKNKKDRNIESYGCQKRKHTWRSMEMEISCLE